MVTYNYTKTVNASQLQEEVTKSNIVVSLDHIGTLGELVTLFFKMALSNTDKLVLDSVVARHIPLSIPSPEEVVTQFEKNDKDLKICSGMVTVDAETKKAEIVLKICGDIALGEGRFISGGYAFSSPSRAGDRVSVVEVVDIDDILGYGAGAVLKTYHDSEIEETQQGWFLNPAGFPIELETMGGYAFAYAGLYLRLKFESLYTDTIFFCNITWGKKG